MATYYVGPGGNNGNSGLTWALRKLTLNGVEDIPVVAGDIVYAGPGVYRERLVIDVSGGAGTEIVYIGDVSGANTDGIGGIIRVTASDDDQTSARGNCISANDKDYRTFRGFHFDFGTGNVIDLIGGCHHWTIEDCTFQIAANNFDFISCDGADQTDLVVRRCVFSISYCTSYCIEWTHVATVDNTNHLVENCSFLCIGGTAAAIRINRIGGTTVRNCLFIGGRYHINVNNSPAAGQTCTINNNIFCGARTASLDANAVGELVEDYNTFYGNSADRVNTNVGANSETYPPILLLPLLHSGASQVSGFQFPWWYSELSEWSQVRAITGSNEPAVDLWGIPRPVTASKNSWGCCQFQDMELESGTVQAGSYARVLNDAGAVLVRRVPCTNVQYTVTLYMRYEANYAGNLPQMIIKQPGQADRNTVMTAAANTWEELSDTFTPSASPGYFEVWAESRNTNGANDKVFYDTFAVS